MTVADCKIEFPAGAPTTTINFVSTSLNFSITKVGYQNLGGEKETLSGRFASSDLSITSVKSTFEILNDTDSALKQARDFLLLIAQNPYDENHLRLTITGETEEWILDGQIHPLNLLLKSGSPDIVRGSFTFDVMVEVSFI